jgi:hypothetical protein
MSDRLERCRTEGVGILEAVLRDAVEALDSAAPDMLLGIVGAGGHATAELARLIAKRAVAALDDEDLAAIVWQGRDFILGSRPIYGGSGRDPRLGDVIAATLEDAVRLRLSEHLVERAEILIGAA